MLAALIVGTCERSNTKLEVDADPWFAQLFAFLSAAAADTKTPRARRILYVRAIGCTDWRFARAPLLALSAMQSDIELRGTVLRAFAGFDEADVCGILLAPDRWGGYTPALGQTVVDARAGADGMLGAVRYAERVHEYPAGGHRCNGGVLLAGVEVASNDHRFVGKRPRVDALAQQLRAALA